MCLSSCDFVCVCVCVWGSVCVSGCVFVWEWVCVCEVVDESVCLFLYVPMCGLKGWYICTRKWTRQCESCFFHGMASSMPLLLPHAPSIRASQHRNFTASQRHVHREDRGNVKWKSYLNFVIWWNCLWNWSSTPTKRSIQNSKRGNLCTYIVWLNSFVFWNVLQFLR